MTNTDERAASFLTRLIALEEVKRGVADDRAGATQQQLLVMIGE